MTLRRLSWLGLIPGLCLHAPLEAQAQAQPPAGSTPTVSEDARSISGLNAAQLFDLADQARVAGRLEDAETIYRALARDPDLKVRSEARFRLGMMLDEQGRQTDAALAFRAILDEEPGATRVRLELARVLAAMGDESRARQQLRQAQANGLPPDVQQVVDRFAAALRSNRRFGGNFELAMAPDSNINRATDAKELDTVIAPLTLDEDAREQSGIGLRLSGQVYARVGLGQGLTLVPRLSGDGTFYRASQFNDLSGSALLGLEWQRGRSRLMPSAGVTWRTYGGKAYARTETADLRWTQRIGRRAQSDVGFSYGQSHYNRNALQDGALYNLSAGIERALSARSGVGIQLSGTRQTARDPGYATASGGATLLGWRDMGRTTLFANATVRRLEADARLALFPERRKEWFLRGSVGATFRQIEVAGFSPVVRLAYERNISTVGIYDYRRTTVDLGITRAF
ncbi:MULTISPECIES: surface lipoprotein assembly modifier [Sphingobium]|uniref:surface lipoprotein assembly modifier n=1 Tax=Sphingobium TaxID=165695 RepID=UPI0015EC928A|nr:MULTISPECIES: surface lipoprotein assembly modifier [Sphingobium]MCW2364528.1 tetratricopeptide (TPR) repeat protein [Sphingobium sp. B10D3B]MCW2402075.1 tetratricopeptide (TPR) repeat protein [Sphingobium sp. B10D7B]MCW2409054.1 tetratricopeptide (TPR) repeat protein [Sphingobium xanthum]